MISHYVFIKNYVFLHISTSAFYDNYINLLKENIFLYK
jgi:hypothetical protein